MKSKVAVTLDRDLLAFIDAEAEREKTSRSDMLERLLLRGVSTPRPYQTPIQEALEKARKSVQSEET